MSARGGHGGTQKTEMHRITPSTDPFHQSEERDATDTQAHTALTTETVPALPVSGFASSGGTSSIASARTEMATAEVTVRTASCRPSAREADMGDLSKESAATVEATAEAGLSLSFRTVCVTPLTDEDRAAKARQERRASSSTMFHPMILCTLANLGNTCYFNSGVQLLCNCPEFVFALRDSPFRPPYADAALMLSRTSTMRTHALYRAFAKLLESMEHHTGSLDNALSPSAALDLLGSVYPAFAGRSQQDCPEVVAAILSNMEDEGRQEVEVDVLLRGFEAAALETELARAALTPMLSPALQSLSHRETLAAAIAAAATTVSSSPSPSKEPYTPPTAVSHKGRPETAALEAPRLAEEELPADGGVLALPGPWSAHTFAALRLMQSVNSSNAAIERRAFERKGKHFDPNTSFRPPRLIRNSATDGFKGYSLSEITCHSCGTVSRIVEPFSSLIIDIPSAKQRVNFAKAHPEIQRCTETGALVRGKKTSSAFCWYNPVTYFICLARAVGNLFAPRVAHNLTLQECLDIHFEAVALKGSNKYQCDSCGQSSEATKRESLVELPEYLFMQMKRFEVGQLLKSKKDDPVLFPTSWKPLTLDEALRNRLPPGTAADGITRSNGHAPVRPEILDLRPYMHADVAKYLVRAPPCLSFDNEGDEAGGAATSASGHPTIGSRHRVSPLTSPPSRPSGHVTSTYTLDGVVNHHGSLGGGHYTVYVRKIDETSGEEKWVYISDDAASAASVDDVANSEEYLLLYRKQAYVEPHGVALELRDKARYYLKRASDAESGLSAASSSSSSTSATVYLSRAWLHRAAFFTDPGPIHNRTCYCRADDRRRVVSSMNRLPAASTRVPQDVPHVHGPPVEWLYVPVDEADYWAFYTAYGGDGPVTEAAYSALAAEQKRFMQEVRRRAQQSSRSSR